MAEKLHFMGMYGEISTKVNDMKNKERKVRYVPPELKWESVPRRRFTAIFDNVLLTLDLTAGANNLNAVVTGWKQPIAKHDQAVAHVEERIDQAERDRKDFQVRE